MNIELGALGHALNIYFNLLWLNLKKEISKHVDSNNCACKICIFLGMATKKMNLIMCKY
jgi:hypothetical protein